MMIDGIPNQLPAQTYFYQHGKSKAQFFVIFPGSACCVNWCVLYTRPGKHGKHTKNYGKSPFLIGKPRETLR